MNRYLRYLNVPRGLLATFIGTLLGALAPVLLVGVLKLVRWLLNDTSKLETGSFQGELEESLFYPPIVGCAAVCGCADWAAYAPRGRRSLAFALALEVFFTTGVWIALDMVGFTIYEERGVVDHPNVREFFAMIGGPALAAAIITAMGVFLLPRPHTELSEPPMQRDAEIGQDGSESNV